MEQPLTLRAFPQAIIHIDADAFFAACEQAANPALKGKPVITGKERGIASAVSYEAKALGIQRGMTTREIQQICPHIIHLPSDYETYSAMSVRMFAIVRRYTELVEEYSIDECFADITGLQRPLRMSYRDIAQRIKRDLDLELGMTFSVGLAPSKVVAKIASKWNKPSGFVVISGKHLHRFLDQVAIENVWGIGEKTTHYLQQFGIRTALDFARKPEAWVRQKVTKPHVEIWHELRGESVLALETQEKHDYQSISKTKTFTPPSSDRAFILAQLSKNTENACIKARRHHLVAGSVYFLLRTQEYQHVGYELRLSRRSAYPHDIVPLIDAHLERIFNPQQQYRLTGVVLGRLKSESGQQLDLFEDPLRVEKMGRIYQQIDAIDQKFGKHSVYLGSSHQAIRGQQYAGERAELPRRKALKLKGEGERKRLGLPLLGKAK